jgi:hypothetical protein
MCFHLILMDCFGLTVSKLLILQSNIFMNLILRLPKILSRGIYPNMNSPSAPGKGGKIAVATPRFSVFLRAR